MLDIKKADLKWNGNLKPLYLPGIKYIMIHHTAHPTWNIYDVHNFHQHTNGWIGIGYNFFINPDGTVFEGRGLNIGAGATGYNYNSIHVCFAGNFENQKPSETQLENGKKLIEYLLTLVPSDVKIIGHRDIGKTACPGKNFPLDEFKSVKKESENPKMFEAGQGKEAIEYLVEQGRITNKEQALQKLDLIKNEDWNYIKWANDVKKLESK